MVYSCLRGTNAELLLEVEKLYLSPGMKILDMTYGKGKFWDLIDLSKYDFTGDDLVITGKDLRDMNYPHETFDVVVLDPPYARRQGRDEVNDRFGLINIDTMSQVYELYFKGITEAKRILKRGGLLLVKCQDATYGKQQHWVHIDVFNVAEALKMQARDLFLLHNLMHDNTKQISARKNHSYLWIFYKRTK